MPDMNCEDCHGSGKLECETLILGRPYLNKKGEMVCDSIGKGDWALLPCHCIDEE